MGWKLRDLYILCWQKIKAEKILVTFVWDIRDHTFLKVTFVVRAVPIPHILLRWVWGSIPSVLSVCGTWHSSLQPFMRSYHLQTASYKTMPHWHQTRLISHSPSCQTFNWSCKCFSFMVQHLNFFSRFCQSGFLQSPMYWIGITEGFCQHHFAWAANDTHVSKLWRVLMFPFLEKDITCDCFLRTFFPISSSIVQLCTLFLLQPTLSAVVKRWFFSFRLQTAFLSKNYHTCYLITGRGANGNP